MRPFKESLMNRPPRLFQLIEREARAAGRSERKPPARHWVPLLPYALSGDLPLDPLLREGLGRAIQGAWDEATE